MRAGASILFAITRFATGDTVASGPQIAKLSAGFKRSALNYMLFLRLVPIFPFCLVNVVPAILGIKFRTFLIGTLIGITPGTMAFAIVGSGLDDVISTAKAAQSACQAASATAQCPFSIGLHALVTPQLQIAFAMLSVLALAPIVVNQWRQRHGG